MKAAIWVMNALRVVSAEPGSLNNASVVVKLDGRKQFKRVEEGDDLIKMEDDQGSED